MSLILDALKKLDREKTSRRHGTSNIAVDILRPEFPRPARRIPFSFLTVTLTAAAVAAATYGVLEFSFLPKSSPRGTLTPPAPTQQAAPPHLNPEPLSKSSPRTTIAPPAQSQQAAPVHLNSEPLPESLPPAPVTPPAPSQQAAPAPPSSESLPKSSPPAAVPPPAESHQLPPAPLPPPATAQQVAPVPPSLESAHDTGGRINPPSPKVQNQTETKDPAPSRDQKETGQNVTLEKATAAPVNPEQKTNPTPIQSATAPPSLRLSAIVWHEEPSKRIAMINGVITTEGTMIEGVKVEEIYPDRVRLSLNGRPFEISLR